MAGSDPFQEMAYFQRRMSRLLEESLSRPRSFLRQNVEAIETGPWEPRVNVYASSDEFLVYVELPGVSSKDEVHLEVKGNLLSVSGIRQSPGEAEGGQPLSTEGSFGAYARSIQLSENIDPVGVTARMRSGVLEIRAPRRQTKKAFQVEIVEFE